jgi:high-affinity nickel-transport protein
MYLVGFLFGLGFDTASEVGLLALAALGGGTAEDGVPPVLVMLLPALFAAGMALVDTCDGLLVLLALAKGDGDNARALLLGAGLTAASASASLGIGLVTAGGLLARWAPSTFGPLAALADALDAHTTAVGLAIVALFAGALGLAAAAPAYRRRSYAPVSAV